MRTVVPALRFRDLHGRSRKGNIERVAELDVPVVTVLMGVGDLLLANA
jgi:hypothetical protein